jgi:hypothetical protein
MVLTYPSPRRVDELRLPLSSDINAAMGGQRYDDRYTVGFTDAKKLEQYWWRDENSAAGYHVRIGFISAKLGTGSSEVSIARKIISVTPGDEEKFLKAMAGN